MATSKETHKNDVIPVDNTAPTLTSDMPVPPKDPKEEVDDGEAKQGHEEG
jgi:hypothetical protein